MMKKLLAIAIVAVLVISMVAFAAEPVPATLTELFSDLDIVTTRSLDVPVDIKIDVDNTGSFVDGVVTKTASSAVTDYKATIYMSDVRTLFSAYLAAARAVTAGVGTLSSDLNGCKVTGTFTIEITYPSNAVVPASVTEGTNLDGFNDAAANIFTETSRTLSTNSDGDKVLTINISVVGPEPARNSYVLASELEANLGTYLPDITFECDDVELPTYGEYKVIGKITGQTVVHDPSNVLVATINYTGKQGTASGITGGTEISETVKLETGGPTPVLPPSPGGNIVKPSQSIEVEVKIPSISGSHKVTIPEDTKNPTVNTDELEKELNPTREGFVFAGFYADEFYTQKLEGDVPVTNNTTIYGRFVNTTVPEIFVDDNHIQYIYGYSDGTVRPEANVTREEITAMLYRLLKPEVRSQLETSENSFSDVAADRWSNVAISSMAKGGYLYGYSDGTFNPEGDITRGELAAIVSRFIGGLVEGERDFNDIDGHWAENSIKSVANNEWIFGYTDGSFKPDAKITRAEAVAIINRIVVRYVTHEGLTGTEKIWPDNSASAWYYYPIIEASHHHDHERDESQYNEIWSNSNAN